MAYPGSRCIRADGMVAAGQVRWVGVVGLVAFMLILANVCQFVILHGSLNMSRLCYELDAAGYKLYTWTPRTKLNSA